MLTINPLANPIVWLAFVVLTMIGILNGLANYAIGKKGLGAIQKRFPNLGEEQLKKIKEMYSKRGPGILILAGIPYLGGMLSMTAGLLNTDLRVFLLWVGLSKLSINAVLLALVEIGFLLFVE